MLFKSSRMKNPARATETPLVSRIVFESHPHWRTSPSGCRACERLASSYTSVRLLRHGDAVRLTVYDAIRYRAVSRSCNCGRFAKASATSGDLVVADDPPIRDIAEWATP